MDIDLLDLLSDIIGKLPDASDIIGFLADGPEAAETSEHAAAAPIAVGAAGSAPTWIDVAGNKITGGDHPLYGNTNSSSNHIPRHPDAGSGDDYLYTPGADKPISSSTPLSDIWDPNSSIL